MNEIYQPVAQPDKDNPTTPNIRASYAQLLQDGHTLGPDDFHDAYHGAGFSEVPDLKTQLPSNQDLLDHSLEALRRSSMPISPETVHTTRKNILDHWAASGQLPDLNNGSTTDAMTREQSYLSPVHQNISGIVRQLESGGLKDPDAAVSSAGAIGRYQIMLPTAKQYYPDATPERLHDAAYNTMVHNAIIDDLSKRYHGQTDAILVAYNAGPMVADRYIANGRDIKSLPEETQGYLKKADRLTYGDDLMKPGRDAVYDPMGTLGTAEEGVGAPVNFNINLAKTLGMPNTVEQHQQVMERVKQMEDEGASRAERLTYQQMNDPFANWLGIGSIGTVTGGLLTKWWYTHAEQAQNALSAEAKEAVQAATRMAEGEGRRFIAAGTAALEGFRKEVNKGVPEFKAWLDTKPGQNTPFWENAPDIMHLIDHMEGGNGGGKLADTSPLKPVADAVRTLNQAQRSMIEAEAAKGNIDIGSFIEDYYRHMWTQPTDADRIFSASRQGSSASLKLRTIPTIADGIAQGLQPRILDPIENTLHYITGMTNYLTSNRVLQEGRAAGYVEYHGSQSDAPPGWQPLVGRGSTIAVPFSNSGAQVLRAYAPAGYASSYNAVTGKGFYEWPAAGDVYQKLQRASNFMTGMKLGLSGYHAAVIANATVASSIANGLGKLTHGDLVDGMKDIGYGITVLPALARGYTRGAKLQKAYLNPADTSDPLMSQLADIYAKVGGRAMGRGMEYGYTQSQNWLDAWKRGSLAMEMKYGMQRTLGDESEALGKRITLAAPRMVSLFGHELARGMASFTAPLFDKAIPKIKMSAWADEMEAWMGQNPGADQEAILRQGRKFSDSMDDRFGEMVQDNLFWNRTLKQAFNLSTVSVGWEYGTIRATAGGIKDLVLNNELSTRARYLLAYPVAWGIMGAAYQYLKTGLAGPTVATPGTDLMTPRTGGTTPEGAPERALLPGEQKEALRWYNLFQSAPSWEQELSQAGSYVTGKMNPFWQLTTGLMTNRNWAGQPIFSHIQDPEKWGLPSHMEELGKAILEEFNPIGIEMNQAGQVLKGTNIPWYERAAGIRPAPEWIQNPERVQGIQQSIERKEIKQDLRRKAYQENRQR